MRMDEAQCLTCCNTQRGNNTQANSSKKMSEDQNSPFKSWNFCWAATVATF